MTKKAFKVEGDFQMGRVRQNFTLEVIGTDDEAAREYAYADLGSRHGVPRRLVRITEVTALEKQDATAVTRKRMGD